MTPPTVSPQIGTWNVLGAPCRLSRDALVAAAILMILALPPDAGSQPLWPPPPVSGLTPSVSLRTALRTTQTGAGLLRAGAHEWGVRAGSASYRPAYFHQDFANMQFRFQRFRIQFNAVASQVANARASRARNIVAELDAGLNIIAELFTLLDSQLNAGTLDTQTVVRTCQAFEAAMREWETELRRNSSRLGSV